MILRSIVLSGMLACLAAVPVYADDSYQQNLKDEKISFSKQAVNDNTLSGYMLVDKISSYQIFAGSVIPGVLVTGMNSDLPGTVIGQVSQNVFDSIEGKYLLIPQGAKLVGIYDTRTAYAQSRGHVIWQRLILPNGKSMVLENLTGSDQQGYAGFKDKVRSHYARVVWSAILGGVITGGVAAATETEDDGSFADEAGTQAANNISNATNNIVNKNLNIAPTVIIEPGYKFNIIVDRDLLLEPYEE